MSAAAIRPQAPLAVDQGDPPGLFTLLRHHLAPAPGRLGETLRLVILVLVAVTLSEIFRIPEPALSAYVVLFVSRGEAASTVMTAAIVGIAILLALLATIIMFSLSLAEPALRIPLVAVATFIAMFLSRTSPLGAAFFGAGFIIAYGLTLGDHVVQLSLLPGAVADTAQFALPELAYMPPEEALVHFLLWLGVVVGIPIALVIATNLLTGRDPTLLLRTALAARLDAAARTCSGEPGAEQALAALAAEGIDGLLKLDHLSGLLHRRGQPRAEMPALIRATGRLGLVLLAWMRLPDQAGRVRLPKTAAFCEAAAHAVRSGSRLATGLEAGPYGTALMPKAAALRPLADELARILAAIDAALMPRPVAARAPGAVRSPRRLLAPDAFTNPAYARFAFKVTLAVMTCYAIETLSDWPAIHTCMITCFFVSLDTVGETVHKATLRILGCLIGGSLGIGVILLLMPLMTDLGDLLLVLAAVTFLAGWIATGSDRIAYAGWQIALAFYIAVLQGYGPTLDMQTARDRIIGILLGNLVVFVIFTTIWPVRVTALVRENLARAVGRFAPLMEAVEPQPAGAARPDGHEAWHGISQAITRARGLLVNDPYETSLSGRSPARHSIGAATLAQVQALTVPASVILALDADPAWRQVPEPARDAVLAYHRGMTGWFRSCAAWIRGAGPPAKLPEPPDAVLLAGEASALDAPVAAHLEARAVWYGVLHRDLCAILEAFETQHGAEAAPDRNASLARA